MNSRLSKLFCLSLTAVFAVIGCKQESKPDIVSRVPNAEIMADMSAEQLRAVKATGGQSAWMNTSSFKRKCVVTFYRPDDTFYLTEQQHEIVPWSNAVEITAAEPQGNLVWKLSRPDSQKDKSQYSGCDLPVDLDGRYYAEAILDITTAALRLLDKSASITEATGPVKLYGQWYYKIRRTDADALAGKHFSDAICYQNKETSLVDMIWFKNINGAGLLVRAFDYNQFEKDGILVPAKIEIFTTDPAGNIEKRLVKIDYH